MATQAQIAANRENAKKSTGPVTAAGKAVASRNAITHGLWARDAVIAGEDPAAFDAFAAAMLAELKPVGTAQRLLAERIVHLWWKLRRVPGLESRTVHQLIEQSGGEQDANAVIAADMAQPRSAMRNLQSHEMRLERSIRACTRELRDLQARAAAEAEMEPEGPVSLDDNLDELMSDDTIPADDRTAMAAFLRKMAAHCGAGPRNEANSAASEGGDEGCEQPARPESEGRAA